MTQVIGLYHQVAAKLDWALTGQEKWYLTEDNVSHRGKWKAVPAISNALSDVFMVSLTSPGEGGALSISAGPTDSC